MHDLVEIGRVRKSHGYKGELKLIVEDHYQDDLRVGKFLFVGADESSALPYEVSQIRGADWIVKLAGVESREECASLLGKILYLRSRDVVERQQPADQEDTTYQELVGFLMVDEEHGEIGKILSTSQYPQQVMAEVARGKRKDPVLVPLNPHLIRGVDFTQHVVFVTLPEGLLDL